MLIISSLDKAPSAYAAHLPARVISLLSEDEKVPVFTNLAGPAHLRLYVAEESGATAMRKAAEAPAQKDVDFA